MPTVCYTELRLKEHKLHEILAMALYLVVCFREHEELPFNYMMLRGDEIARARSSMSEHYRFYLLPEQD